MKGQRHLIDSRRLRGFVSPLKGRSAPVTMPYPCIFWPAMRYIYEAYNVPFQGRRVIVARQQIYQAAIGQSHYRGEH